MDNNSTCNMKMADQSRVSSYYAGKKILVTGGTGFMGKVLIWKLLQSCPKLDVIYLLMRPKHGKNSISRKKEIFDSPMFDNFKIDNPKIFEKVVIITGDVGEEGIGLSDEDCATLIDNVSVVFHGAAVLKMDADLRKAVNVNTVGTVRMLDVSQKMKKLEAFVYISTAYCCCENTTVEEKIYPSKQNPQDMINLILWMESEILKTITPKLIYPLPNTYTYSKRLTESLLSNYKTKIPLIIARPTIVIPSYKEPSSGWHDTLNGPMGIFVAGGRGIMRTCLMNQETKSDLIPVDIAINSIITLPWANSKLEEIGVYNISQTAYEHMTWRDILNQLENTLQKYPPNKFLWYPNLHPTTDNVLIYTIKCTIFHYLPAYIIDLTLSLFGQKPFLVRIHDKLRQGIQVLKYFTQQEWTFLHDKILHVEQSLNETDKKIFPVNMKEITNFQTYLDNIQIADKIFFFKEDAKTLDRAKKTIKIMYVVDKMILLCRYFILWKILSFAFNILLSIIELYRY